MINNLQEARKALVERAGDLGLLENLGTALNVAWDGLYAKDPRLFLKEVFRHGAFWEIYTPAIGDAIKAYDEVLESEATPELVDAARIDFDGSLLNLYVSEGKRPEAIEKMKDQIEGYCQRVYEGFRGKDEIAWNSLHPEAKKDLMRGAIAVLTDGSRILGIGYQGEKGRKICSGKLRCYFLGSDGAVLPQLSFPFGVNFGTKENRRTLIESGVYDDYMHLILEAFGDLELGLVQFEDFEGKEAWRLLQWTRENLENSWVFNDDIEGTAAMMAEALLKIQDEGVSLEESLFLFVGAGGAGSGIFEHGWWLIEEEMRKRGASFEEISQARKAKERIFFFDSAGLLYKGREVKQYRGEREFKEFQQEDGLVMEDKEMLRVLRSKLEDEFGRKVSVEEVLDCFADNLGEKGSIIFLGTSTQPGTISEEAVRRARTLMDEKNIGNDIYLSGSSNPTEKTDFLAKEESLLYEQLKKAGKSEKAEFVLESALLRLYKAAGGKIKFATGSPFPSLRLGEQIIETGQGNNILVFPGMFGLLISEVRPKDLIEKGYSRQEIWRNLWQRATEALFTAYKAFDKERFKRGVLFPKADDVTLISTVIAEAVFYELEKMTEGRESYEAYLSARSHLLNSQLDLRRDFEKRIKVFLEGLEARKKMVVSREEKEAVQAFFEAGERYLEYVAAKKS